jgi:hypothetical protein
MMIMMMKIIIIIIIIIINNNKNNIKKSMRDLDKNLKKTVSLLLKYFRYFNAIIYSLTAYMK